MINTLKGILLKTVLVAMTGEHIEYKDEMEHPPPAIKIKEEVRTTEHTVEATFYGPDCKGCSGITKSGHNVKNTIYVEGYRVIAVDPKIIPLGSIVKVELENGMEFEAIASDTGGDIKNMRIDVLVSSEKESFKYGRIRGKVKIVK